MLTLTHIFIFLFSLGLVRKLIHTLIFVYQLILELKLAHKHIVTLTHMVILLPIVSQTHTHS